jgi:hypothetical protein
MDGCNEIDTFMALNTALGGKPYTFARSGEW